MNELAVKMAEGDFSMMAAEWLDELFRLAGRVEKVPGAVVECGVYNGGSAAMLTAGAGMEPRNGPRNVWLFDSWKGNPAPGKFDGPRAVIRWNETGGKMDVGTMAKTRRAFREVDVKCKLRLERGWFHETITAFMGEIGPIALLHVDADWYKCVRTGLLLYGQVVPGGLVIVHDYESWPGARRAVNELVATIQPEPELGRVAKSGCWWIK